jgi:hypothetical protein
MEEVKVDKAEAGDAPFLCGVNQPVRVKSLVAAKSIQINLLLAGEK